MKPNIHFGKIVVAMSDIDENDWCNNSQNPEADIGALHLFFEREPPNASKHYLFSATRYVYNTKLLKQTL